MHCFVTNRSLDLQLKPSFFIPMKDPVMDVEAKDPCDKIRWIRQTPV